MPSPDLAFRAHDHARCAASALHAAQTLCAARNLRLTPARARVLEILLEAHRALGAYEILERLREDGQPAQPPVAYRALNFLCENGLAHRIERLNAFVACVDPQAEHDAAFLICRRCDRVAESPRDQDAGHLGAAAADAGFAIERTVVEALGLCPDCQGGQP
ncbi:Fur family transcriptional regulator [Oceanibium sediminis]|uniref:Fur family transcriptional regulator n=1 Tax=Oceanibium sediminis TaxID=2026339 RepID=UPI000DD3E92D|nr:Fur family transcriptional regulator [Oceanibium sediminis]